MTWDIGRFPMKTAFQHAVLPWIVALATVPMSALAEYKPSIGELYEITLDIDNDGKIDRAAMVRHPDGAQADLYIYLAVGDEKLDLSRKPSFLKKDLMTERMLSLESKGKGSLIVHYGCGGCSNDYETTLTIVHRGGEFLVAGFTYDWETRYSVGSCDINFLSGKGLVSHGPGEGKQIKEKFTPTKLADWSDDKRPKACGF